MIALLLAVMGCGNQTPSAPADDAVTDTEPAIQTGNSSNRLPLPDLNNSPEPQVQTAAIDDPGIARSAPVNPTRAAKTRGLVSPRGVPPGTQTRVKLKLLPITATETETGFDAMKTFMTRIGVPFDVLVASQTILTSDKLEAEPGLANYSSVILTVNNLAYFDGTNWLSAFDPIEWQILSDFERNYKIRQVTMYAYPDGANTELNYTDHADTSSTELNVALTTQGK